MYKSHSQVPCAGRISGRKVRSVSNNALQAESQLSGLSVPEVMVTMLDNDIWPESLFRNYPSISSEEQSRLIRSKIAIIGCGGLGGYLASFCVRVGVGNLLLADNDLYDVTNINRQCLCTEKTVGSSKAEMTAQYCRDIHPWVETHVITEKISSKNAEKLLAGVDLVLDGLDNIADRLTVFKAAQRLSIPFIHGAVMGWCGQTATFLPETNAGLKSIYPNKEEEDATPSVLAPTVAIVAALQGQEAFRILTGKKPKNEGTLVYYDGVEMNIFRLNLLPDTTIKKALRS